MHNPTENNIFVCGALYKLIQKKANISSRVDNSEVSADSYSEVKEAKPGSMMAKANMVRDYNEKNSRK